MLDTLYPLIAYIKVGHFLKMRYLLALKLTAFY